MVDTARVKDRRPLRFDNLDELLADVDRIVASDRAGTLRTSGNWTPGQILNHIASWIDFAYEGFPMRVPWFIRVILKMKRTKYLKEGMPSGVKIPGPKEGTFATEPMNTTDAADKLRRVVQRLKSGDPAKYESPAFGPMSLEERVALNLRHAELHLSFLHPS